MKYTYTRIKDFLGFTIEFRCMENADISIIVERGSISHNRPCGFTLRYKGEFHSGWQTLREAKEMATELK
jgi:hypothetical protein